jgi:hypothetical protein
VRRGSVTNGEAGVVPCPVAFGGLDDRHALAARRNVVAGTRGNLVDATELVGPTCACSRVDWLAGCSTGRSPASGDVRRSVHSRGWPEAILLSDGRCRAQTDRRRP